MFGVFAYVWAGVRNLFRPRHARLIIRADGEERRYVAHTVLVTNIGAIGDLHLKVSPDTSPHDGYFDLTVISSRTFWDLVKVLARMITWRRPKTRRLRHLRARELRIEAEPPLPVQIDGESLGSTPFAASVVPAAVELIVGSRYDRRIEQDAEAASRTAS
jgi:diacylglycerol kinase family enzyme